MNHQEASFQDPSGATIYSQAWLPDGEPRAVLLIVHGLAEHSGRYANVVEYLVPRGYVVYTFDHLGHGRSSGKRAHVRRFGDYAATLHTCLGTVRDRYPGLPTFAFGHSMGALITAYYVLDHPTDLDGIILSGMSAQMPEDITPATLLLAKALSALVPKAPVQALESAHISRDLTVVQAYVNDPLVHTRPITARTGVELLKAQARVMTEAQRITLPVLMVHGGNDQLCPLAGARSFYEVIGSADKRLKVYEGLYHEVCNEPERALVLSDINDWLQAHL